MIKEVDGRTAPEPTLAAVHLVETEADPHDFGEPPRPLSEAISSYRNPGTANRRRWLATAGQEPAGAGALSNYGGSLVIGSVMVRPSFRRRGIGKTLFDAVVEAARADGIKSFYGEHASADGAAFARAMGAVDDQRHVVSIVELRTAHLPEPVFPAGVERLRSWVGAAPRTSCSSRSACTQCNGDAPVPGPRYARGGRSTSNVATRERWIVRRMSQHVTVAPADREVIALTSIRVPDSVGAASRAYRRHDDRSALHATARPRVVRQARACGRLRAGRPDIERVATQNAAQNEAMLAVNRMLGFVAVLTLTTAVVTL